MWHLPHDFSRSFISQLRGSKPHIPIPLTRFLSAVEIKLNFHLKVLWKAVLNSHVFSDSCWLKREDGGQRGVFTEQPVRGNAAVVKWTLRICVVLGVHMTPRAGPYRSVHGTVPLHVLLDIPDILNDVFAVSSSDKHKESKHGRRRSSSPKWGGIISP